MAHRDSAQSYAKMAKTMQKHPYFDVFPRKAQTQNDIIFFLIFTSRFAESVEGLNSSLALAAGNLWPKKVAPICWLAQSLKG